MNPDSSTPAPAEIPHPAASALPATATPIVETLPVAAVPTSPKSWLWIPVLLIVLLVLGGGVYILASSLQKKSSTETAEIVTTMPTIAPPFLPTSSVTPTISTSDSVTDIENDLNSTQVTDDTSGYTTVETDLKSL